MILTDLSLLMKIFCKYTEREQSIIPMPRKPKTSWVLDMAIEISSTMVKYPHHKHMFKGI